MKINSHTTYSKPVDYRTGDIVGLLPFEKLKQHPDIRISNSIIHVKLGPDTANEYSLCSVERYEKCYQFGRFVINEIIEHNSCSPLYKLRATIDKSNILLFVPELFIFPITLQASHNR